MSSTPYMPLYIGDYLSDTTDLSTEEHGAYLLLLMAMWKKGGHLPNNPAKLAQICRVTPRRWPQVWAAIEQFFVMEDGTVTNDRLRSARENADKTATKRAEAGSKGGTAKALKDKGRPVANATAGPKHSHISMSEDGGGGSACAREADLTDRERILEAIGVDPVSGLTGRGGCRLGTQADMAEARLWLELPGMTLETICAEVRRIMSEKADGPPSSFRYFTTAMRRLSAALAQAPLTPLQVIPGGKANDRLRFDAAHREFTRRLAAGEIQRGPDPSDPFA
ncbi:DUF1376 domain-containing protein [Cereibacter sphaeroides]|uniref:YdaU family protein n=1 Tax=Cereibacter sphaeroides TaxID=1063 RepID=UPI000F526D46|nr:DUF1376 domain-containing protein [Cereibacter sphaeroides]AZB63879.1 DUF1376 domain-containing protein [Cereibacter sphaeroides]AZB68199.1 DUF1376 domain-containing protein [Cereibacter sphaeroides]